jgi:glc operon protein GlcG
MRRMSSPQWPNPYGPPIPLAAARAVAAAALARAQDRGWTIAVAVVDTAGDLVCFERMDHTQLGSIQVAIEKARCSARFKRPTRTWEDTLGGGKQAVLGLPGVLPLQGGIPLLLDDRIVGAVGVSGALPAEDTECAEAGASATRTAAAERA